MNFARLRHLTLSTKGLLMAYLVLLFLECSIIVASFGGRNGGVPEMPVPV